MIKGFGNMFADFKQKVFRVQKVKNNEGIVQYL